MASTSPPPLRLTGHRALTTRIVLSTLTGRPIHITKIRPTSLTAPGLAPHEISFLRLIDAITNGAHIEISSTGTSLLYRPGLITGSSGFNGGVVTHEIPAACRRGATYFLEPLCLLAPFGKAPLRVRLAGPGCVTGATPAGDASVDTLRTAVLPLWAHFGVDISRVDLSVVRRACAGAPPASSSSSGEAVAVGGGGEVKLEFNHQLRAAKTVHLLRPGRVRRIRGAAYGVGVGGAANARAIEAARGVLNDLAPDTRIFSDSAAAPLLEFTDSEGRKAKRRAGVGFGLALVAETAGGARYAADAAPPPGGRVPPEEVGRRAAFALCEEVARGGFAGAAGGAARAALVLMAVGPEDVGRIVLGREVVGSEEMVALARDFRAFGLGAWGLRDAEGEEGVVVSIVGSGLGNVGRKIG
jgi:RNA 3'-terminal phosphate cyclase-like protein